MIDWGFVWSWVAARVTENVVDLVIGAVVILFLFLLIAFRLLWDNHIRYWIDGLRRRFGGKGDEEMLKH